jgi:hypothetical protein
MTKLSVSGGGGGGAAGATTAFTIIQPDTGTSPTATTASDTLIVTNTDGNISISGNSGTKTLTVNMSSTAALNDPSVVLERMWDFIGYDQINSSILDGWGSVSSGSGASVNVAGGTALDTSHPGIARLRSGTTTTGAAIGFQGATFAYGQGVYTYEALVQLSALSDGTDTYVALIGHGNDFSSTADLTNGCYFRYTDSSSSGNWEFVSANGGTRTTRDTGVAAVAGSWVKLKYIVNAAGNSAQAYINGVAAGAAVTTNIATASNRLHGPHIQMRKSAGTTSRDLVIDYIKIRYVFTTAR